MASQLKIDFVSDVSCPWRVIGLKSLEEALARIGNEIRVELHFQPFELNPKMAAAGQEITEHITEKYGITPAQANANRENIRMRGLKWASNSVRPMTLVVVAAASTTPLTRIDQKHVGINNTTIADAILDRVMQRNHRFTLTGESLRHKPKASKKEINPDPS